MSALASTSKQQFTACQPLSNTLLPDTTQRNTLSLRWLCCQSICTVDEQHCIIPDAFVFSRVLKCGCLLAVHLVQSQLGWVESDDTDEWDLFWSDQSISLARAVAMQPMQVNYCHHETNTALLQTPALTHGSPANPGVPRMINCSAVHLQTNQFAAGCLLCQIFTETFLWVTNLTS